jgi:hypothetical protein
MILLLTQVITPVLFGTPFFPLFRKSTELKKEVDALELTLEEKEELVLLKMKLSKLKAREAELESKENGTT